MKINVKETVIFAMLGALMYMSKLLMDALPNIHLIGVFIVAITVVYRKKALYPIYIFVLIAGLLGGFSAWWVPYLYIWTVLWGMIMLLPKNLPPKAAPVIYMVVCSLHGFIYGILYAPAQALMFGLDFKGMLAWIAAGFPFDITHGISNFLCGSLIVPLIHAIRLADKAAKN
ncbi:MAG: hypothetical protein E7555_06855 [Ruminococcaceae bacterium]|nr:hypothetical protein [Oscillospiraceae bacterium]